MSDTRALAMTIRLSPAERGLVASLRERLDGRPLAPIVRDAIVTTARRLTTTSEEHADE